MKRYVVAALLLAGATIAVGGGGLLGLDPEPAPRYDEWTLVPLAGETHPWGWAVALLALAVVPLVQHVAVVVAWAWQPIAARRRAVASLAARIEIEAPLLEDYEPGAVLTRIGHRPDAVANQAA